MFAEKTMYNPGDIVYLSDDNFHTGLIVFYFRKISFLLMLTSRPGWNNHARIITKEESALFGFPDKGKRSYFAPVMASNFSIDKSNRSPFPEHRIKSLRKEFPIGKYLLTKVHTAFLSPGCSNPYYVTSQRKKTIMSTPLLQRYNKFFMSKENMERLFDELSKIHKLAVEEPDAEVTDNPVETIYEGVCNSDEIFAGDLPLQDCMESIFKDAASYSPSFDDNGNMDELMFDGTTEDNQESFLKAIAPYVKSGSYIECDDGTDMWRWWFKDSELKRISPEISWENDNRHD